MMPIGARDLENLCVGKDTAYLVSERIRQMRIKPEKEGNCILMERKRGHKRNGEHYLPRGKPEPETGQPGPNSQSRIQTHPYTMS